ncbi:MAG: chondroitinase family polysaccharide lyase, partial [Bacteroidales bacterium]|nr:chondroitinase family polysaccharide lyase [Bacteroidales bacterium]
VEKYEQLNIVVNNGSLTGNQFSYYKSVPFLKTFAQQLRQNPNDELTGERANNTVQLLTQQVCAGTLKIDPNCYEFRSFAKNAVVLYPYLYSDVRSLLDYTLNQHKAFNHLWEPAYDKNYQRENGAINTDIMYNLGTTIMCYAASQITANERYRWMTGYNRWVGRYTSYTSGTADGVKIDGTGFHHWSAYDGYMYSFHTASKAIYYLSGTRFQIEKENYLFFRNALYAKIVMGNESGVKALSMSGRHPDGRSMSYSSSSFKDLALAGGSILELSTADPVLAGEYNRIWGVSSDFNYDVKAPLSLSSGFYQFNHANAGIFRKNEWLVVMKGFSNGLWGSEAYPTANRYGRYQSYGTLEIIYSGSLAKGNGYDADTWNWNYNPGATTIVLPWSKLHGERGRIDEYQEHAFAGALAFKNKNSEALKETHGTYGMFAMNFREKEGQGFNVTYGPNTHNGTFRFKKSTFVFEDDIICLGSNISNDDTENPTVTTLFQRMDNSSMGVILNGNKIEESIVLDTITDHWLISNYGTGFYIVEGNDEVKLWNGSQQTPNKDQTDPGAYTGNSTGAYWISHINHGKNPQEAAYEYIVVPESDKVKMEKLEVGIRNGNKPYTVHQKDGKAHVLEHETGIWAYAVFKGDSILNNEGTVNHVSAPCLIMYEENSDNGTMKMSISNPDMGFTPRTYMASVAKEIVVSLKGRWLVNNAENTDIELIERGQNTAIKVITNDGLPEEFELKWDGPLLKSLKINGSVPSGWNSFRCKTNVRLTSDVVPDVKAIALNPSDEVSITLPNSISGDVNIELAGENGIGKNYVVSFSTPKSHMEDFEKLDGSGMMNAWYSGNNEQMWYVNGRLGEFLGSGNSIYFYPDQGGVVSEAIPGGISSFSFEVINYRSTDTERIIEVYINDSLIVQQANSGDQKVVVQADGLKFYPNAVFKIVNATESARAIAVDNISWIGYAPERNAYLDYIKVNGKLLDDFDPANSQYYLDNPEIFSVDAEAQSDKANIDIEIPEDTTGMIKILVTAQDASWNEYKVDFHKATGKIDTKNQIYKVYPNP